MSKKFKPLSIGYVIEEKPLIVRELRELVTGAVKILGAKEERIEMETSFPGNGTVEVVFTVSGR